MTLALHTSLVFLAAAAAWVVAAASMTYLGIRGPEWHSTSRESRLDMKETT